MISRFMISWFIRYAVLIALSLCWSVVGFASSPLDCDGPFKGRRLTPTGLKKVLLDHQRWLARGAKAADKGRANLCGADLHGMQLNGVNLSYANLAGSDMSQAYLSHSNLAYANLYKAYFRWSRLEFSNLQRANLKLANFVEATLQGSNLRLVNLEQAKLSQANLQAVDLRSANLRGAILNRVNLTEANLTWADLSGASLIQARLDRAIFKEALLRGVDLSYASLKQADFSRADFQSVLFQPRLGGLPNLVALATSRHFNTVQFPGIEGTAALLELQTAYKKLGIRSLERKMTAMIKIKQMHEAWRQGSWGYVDSLFSYIFFYMTSDFGAEPGRALRLFLLLMFLCALPYRLSLSLCQYGPGVYVIWESRFLKPAKQLTASHAAVVYQKRLRRRVVRGVRSACLEQWRLVRIALYFSFLSAFNVGWRELPIANWILNLQRRDYRLKSQGWVRVLSGFQSLLSAYLLVLWIMTYFGRPFEW